jgi:hypothetical protein
MADHPKLTELEPDEVIRINRARLAILLHKTPHEIDATPVQDLEDLIAVKHMDDEINARKQQGK